VFDAWRCGRPRCLEPKPGISGNEIGIRQCFDDAHDLGFTRRRQVLRASDFYPLAGAQPIARMIDLA
jgi:hypothetical protein